MRGPVTSNWFIDDGTGPQARGAGHAVKVVLIPGF